MSNPSRIFRRNRTAIAALAAVTPTAARTASAHHCDIEIGGTGAAADAPAFASTAP